MTVLEVSKRARKRARSGGGEGGREREHAIEELWAERKDKGE